MTSVVFDLTASQPNDARYHGGGEYAKVVFQRVIEELDGEAMTAIFYGDRWIDPEVVKVADKFGVSLEPIEDPRDLQGILDSQDHPRFYSALPFPFADLDFANTDLIYTIHGLRPLELPTDRFEFIYGPLIRSGVKQVAKTLFSRQYYNSKRRQFQSLFSAKCRSLSIIVPSYHTKSSLRSHFGDEIAGRVYVIPSPLKEMSSNTDELDIMRRYGIKPEKYLLLVSGGRWIKNSFRAIQAIDGALSLHQADMQVLVVGVSKPEVLKRATKNAERFIFIDYVDESTLQMMYAHAYAFVYPTLNEGYGYPPLECMRFGTPVLSSAIASTTEVLKDSVVYFNPYSVEEMKNRVLMILSESAIHREFRNRGLRRFAVVEDEQPRMLKQLSDLILARGPIKDRAVPMSDLAPGDSGEGCEGFIEPTMGV